MTRQKPGPVSDGALDRRPLRVLVVDQEPSAFDLLSNLADSGQVQLAQVHSLGAARQYLNGSAVDLALIEPQMPDGCGVALAEEVRRRGMVTQTIMISRDPSLERAVAAMRAGAADFIVKPLCAEELRPRVDLALRRGWQQRARRKHVLKLKRHCTKLQRLRRQMAQQMDVLCKDLVTAYQELAQHLHQTLQATEFSSRLGKELDPAQVVRKTLEFMLDKTGPTNAAIFLPAGDDEFVLGGSVNYDCASDSLDMLLDHLGDVVGKRIGASHDPIYLDSNRGLRRWLGDDAAYLLDRQVLTFSCCRQEEAMAVVLLFRDASEPFDSSLVHLASVIGPMLGDLLAKVVRIHHRKLDDGHDGHWNVTA